eukprot:SAG31_NODE_2032_length_6625_cov_3.010113_4_plen_77_part_00
MLEALLTASQSIAPWRREPGEITNQITIQADDEITIQITVQITIHNAEAMRKAFQSVQMHWLLARGAWCDSERSAP